MSETGRFPGSFLFGASVSPKFGVVGIDRQTFERRPKPNLSWLDAVAGARSLSGASAPE